MNESRRPPWKRKPFVVDSTPETLPGDFQFPETLPADFAFDDQPTAQTPAPPRETSWSEALFPRSTASASMPAWAPQSLSSAALDVASLPGRAVASLVRPDGESFPESMSRIAASPRAGERGTIPGQQVSETILRDPATGALMVVPTWIPAKLLASTARGALLARGGVAGLQAGGTLAASRQAENMAGGDDLSATEAAQDVGLGAGLGLGGQAFGSGLRALGRNTVPAAMKLVKVGKKMREGVERAFPKMIERGILAPTVRGMERNMERMGSDISGRYQAATAGTEGVPAVPLRSYGAMAAQRLGELADAGKLGPDDELAAAEWIMSRAYRPAPAGAAASPAMVDMPTAIATRSATRKAAGSYESQAPTSARREALQEAADEFAARINDRIAQTNPAVREVDRYAAPYYQFDPFMDALAARGNNYGIGLTELGAGGLGAGLGSVGGPAPALGTALGLGALARAQRSPLYPYLLNQAGRVGEAVGRAPGRLSRVGATLRGSSTDNAR